ncbi:hypothetical protein HDU76_010719 [Blyttiomyces sp. JEL0837]|nr:hypothetical protein HDU76_010719 [Blyttiomyces sp. JEL0837]
MLELTKPLDIVAHNVKTYLIDSIPTESYRCLIGLHELKYVDRVMGKLNKVSFPTSKGIRSLIQTGLCVVVKEDIEKLWLHVDDEDILDAILDEIPDLEDQAKKKVFKAEKRVDDRNLEFDEWWRRKRTEKYDAVKEYLRKFPQVRVERARGKDIQSTYNYSMQKESSASRHLDEMRRHIQKNTAYLYSHYFNLSLSPVDPGQQVKDRLFLDIEYHKRFKNVAV